MVGQGMSLHQLSNQQQEEGLVWAKCSEDPVAFMSGGVRDYITTGGGATLAIGCGIQMECHLLGDKSVKVHVMKTVPATTQGLSWVSGGAGGTRANRDAGHGTTEACGQKHRIILLQII